MQSLATAGRAGCGAGRGLQPSARYAAPRQAHPRQVQHSQCHGPGTGALQVRSGHVRVCRKATRLPNSRAPSARRSRGAVGVTPAAAPGRGVGGGVPGAPLGRGLAGPSALPAQPWHRHPLRPPSAVPGHAAPPASLPRAQKPRASSCHPSPLGGPRSHCAFTPTHPGGDSGSFVEGPLSPDPDL